MTELQQPALVNATLEGLDHLQADDLALCVFEDERPLRGVAGLVDWRLCGQLSSFLLSGRVGGGRGERVLVPSADRIGPRRIFIFGVGPREGYREQLADLANVVPDVLQRAGCRRVALALPGPSRVVVPPLHALVRACRGSVIEVFDPDGQLREWLMEGASA